MKQKPIFIKKNSFDVEPFSTQKLEHSLLRSGASEEEIENIISKIQTEIYDGISSIEIYKKVFAYLKKSNSTSASRYSLKRAIFDLGPTGYPFERLVAALLREKGFKTSVSVILYGECVTHEIDVLAEKEGSVYAIECKFHSDSNAVSNVKIPLYINSRFLDIQKQWNTNSKNTTHLKQGWLVTNTRFTIDAINYAKCVGLNLLSWDYPLNNGIKDNIDSFDLYPITTLINLSKDEKTTLISKDIILVKELYENKIVLEKMRITSDRIVKILNEVKELYKI
jgi:Holliday junction resolvase-like predicted endonuclease